MQEDNADNNLNNEQLNSMFSDAAPEEIPQDAINNEGASLFGAADFDNDKLNKESSEINAEAEEVADDKNINKDVKNESLFDETEDNIKSESNEADLPKEKINLKFGDDDETQTDDSLITVRPVRFQEFDEPKLNLSMKKNLDIMQDIPMHITVELGRTKSTIKDIINMDIGSVVELDKIAGEQVEIYANERLIARGEVIVIEDKFGVRVVNTNIQKETV